MLRVVSDFISMLGIVIYVIFLFLGVGGVGGLDALTLGFSVILQLAEITRVLVVKDL